ncbi:MAG: hypothetical protein AAGU15_09785 [Anaerolineaceae bacterium]|jgi:hypothetical protein
MQQFYVLHYFKTMFPAKISYYEVIQPKIWAPPITCAVCGQNVGPELWLPPQRVRLSSANPDCWQDVMWGVPGLFLVSERFRKIYEGEGLTGLDPFDPPVVIEKLGKYKKGVFPVDLPTYYLASIPWGRGVIDQEKSEFVYEHRENEIYCRLGRHNGFLESFERYMVKEGSWPGDDFFAPISPQWICLGSDRLAQIMKKYDIRGLNLVPVEKFVYRFHGPRSYIIRED